MSTKSEMKTIEWLSLRLSLRVSSIFMTVGRGGITTELTTCGGNKYNMMAITPDDVKENYRQF